MKNLKCKNCGGTMVLDASAVTAVCRYCGSKYVLNREDTDYYHNFFLQMGKFLSGSDEEKNRKERAEELWLDADEIDFSCSDGSNIQIKYMYSFREKEADVYVARRNIIYHFAKENASKAEDYRRNIAKLDYPSADVRSLSDFFPKISGGFVLKDGSFILVVSKDEDEYPLRLFGILSGRHTAWVISRLENLCCVLEFSNIAHPEINPDTVFINPYTHQASLYGNWWAAGMNNDLRGLRRLKVEENLKGLRNTAAELLGFEDSSKVRDMEDVPKVLTDFVAGKPCSNAYDDFAKWDDTLIKAYGERKFVRMDTEDEEIYGKV